MTAGILVCSDNIFVEAVEITFVRFRSGILRTRASHAQKASC
jgi:hypothetical protein